MLRKFFYTFCHYSGYFVNRLNTQIFFSRNIPENGVTRLSSYLGFPNVNDLGLYLGMPIFHGRMRLDTFQFLVDKVRARLNGWEV